MEYRYGSHTVFQIEYHFVWVTKYRYKVLRASSVRISILMATASKKVVEEFAEVETNLATARENAKASQIDAAKKDIQQEASFRLLSSAQKRKLMLILQGGR